jgi:FkbM family methyltransferase
MDVRIRTGAKKLLATMPLLDGLFRRFIWSHRHFPEAEMAFLHSLPPHSVDVAVDVGAAMGGYAWLLDRVSNQVIAFEPGAWHFDYLSGLLFATNIKLVNAALGAYTGEAELYTAGEGEHARHAATLNTSNPIAHDSEARVETVTQTSLDGYLATSLAADSRVDIIKVDPRRLQNSRDSSAARHLRDRGETQPCVHLCFRYTALPGIYLFCVPQVALRGVQCQRYRGRPKGIGSLDSPECGIQTR